MKEIVAKFTTDLSLGNVPEKTLQDTKRCLLDTIGVAAAGSRLQLSSIARNVAPMLFGVSPRGARLFFADGHTSPAGAAFVNASTIDSFDAHDGHPLTKGHAGCGVLSGLMAIADVHDDMSGTEALINLIAGYEVAIRAGIALHQTAPDYHTSGAWVGLGIVAAGARVLNLDRSMLREGLGIAEYNGPRSQMMRCIDHPTMLKDGSGWGAMVGVSAAFLAKAGFTGAPAITVEEPAVETLWNDLGSRWRISEQYLKAYPVCRWAQPAMEAAMQLKREHKFTATDILSIRIRTFHEASRLKIWNPQTTEIAQYSLPFPVAALLVKGQVGPDEIDDAALADREILSVAKSIEVIDDPEFSGRFPAERWASASITLRNGTILESRPAVARGSAENPFSDDEITTKFKLLMESAGHSKRVQGIVDYVWGIEKEPSLRRLADMIYGGR
ncbi:MAG: MmgE/PrpD family protein [Hyphomicrobiales bacterium]